MKILIVGSQGMLGNDLVKVFEKHELLLPDEIELDITNQQKVSNYILKETPELIINAAAYTNVDGCEEEANKELAFKVNGYGPGYLAKAAEAVGAVIVHISTDYVFAGDKNGLYEVEDPVNPINVYGETKLLGEQEVMGNSSKYFILRTAWLYGPAGANFVKTMLKLSESRKEINVVNDQFGSPTYTLDLANKIKELVTKDKYGIYHTTNSGYCSWYDFAKLIFSYAGIDMIVNPVSSEEFIRPAKRPHNSRMSNKKLVENGYSILRGYEEALREYIATEVS